VTKDDRKLNFQPVPTQKLYRFFTFSLPKLNFCGIGPLKPVVFRSNSGFGRRRVLQPATEGRNSPTIANPEPAWSTNPKPSEIPTMPYLRFVF